jgi:hypothetical protein
MMDTRALNLQVDLWEWSDAVKPSIGDGEREVMGLILRIDC